MNGFQSVTSTNCTELSSPFVLYLLKNRDKSNRVLFYIVISFAYSSVVFTCSSYSIFCFSPQRFPQHELKMASES